MKVFFEALNTFRLALSLLVHKALFSYSPVTANITVN